MAVESVRAFRTEIKKVKTAEDKLPIEYRRAIAEINYRLKRLIGMGATANVIEQYIESIPRVVLDALDYVYEHPRRKVPLFPSLNGISIPQENFIPVKRVVRQAFFEVQPEIETVSSEEQIHELPDLGCHENVTIFENIEEMEKQEHVIFSCPADQDMMITKSSKHSLIVSKGKRLTKRSYRYTIDPLHGALGLFHHTQHGAEIHCKDCPLEEAGCVIFNAPMEENVEIVGA